MRLSKTIVGVGLAALALGGAPVATAATLDEVSGINGVRGLDIGSTGKTVISKANGAVIRVIRSGPREGERIRIAKVPANFLAPSVAVADDKSVWILTAGGEEVTRGLGTLYLKKPGERRHQVVNIQRWAAKIAAGVDPFALETDDPPTSSNPYNVVALPGGAALVADAANNSVLKVTRKGKVSVVARVKPRVVEVSEEMQQQMGLPPEMPAEAVTTSVAVGDDGTVYIGELRGFPGTAGTSQVWQVAPGATGAVCDPEAPDTGDCTRKADGFTSIVALEAGRGGALYVAELSKLGWFAMEDPEAGPEAFVGSVFRLGHDDNVKHEIAAGEVVLPGAVAESPRGGVFVSGPIFGPGGFQKIS